MIKQIETSPQDIAEVSKLKVDPDSIKNEFYDYSKVVVDLSPLIESSPECI